MADIREGLQGINELDRSIGLLLIEFYESMKRLERDEHRGGKQATAIVMAINDVKSAAGKDMSKWISVKEERPEAYRWVLVYNNTGDVGDFPFDIGRIVSGEWRCLGWDYPVTHWVPLPEAPSGN